MKYYLGHPARAATNTYVLRCEDDGVWTVMVVWTSSRPAFKELERIPERIDTPPYNSLEELIENEWEAYPDLLLWLI